MMGCSSSRWSGRIPLITADVTRDAVLVIPGIMGSELVDAGSGETLWGLADAGWYCRAWTTGSSLRQLAVTEDERAGRSKRVRATRLLRFPAFMPVLRGMEPYSDLLTGLRRVVAHPDAIAEFPYDWRLSIGHNAGELARAVDGHLHRWRVHPMGSREARLVLVAHSMGGLVARYFTTVLGGASDVRTTITLGTPFYGSAQAALMLNSGRFPGLPHRRLRTLAATLPGVHDLLPSYRCVDEGSTARRLTPSDVAAFGGDEELAAEAFARRERLLSPDDLHALVGVEQHTVQSLVLRDGVVEPEYYTCEDGPTGLSRVDRLGDSTVYRDAAAPAGVTPDALPQRHGAIARTPEAIAFVRALLTGRPLGPPLTGEDALQLCLPEVIATGEPFEVSVTNTDDPTGISCWIENAYSAARVAHPELARLDGTLAAGVVIRYPGLYRVMVKRGGRSAVGELMLVVPLRDLSGVGS